MHRERDTDWEPYRPLFRRPKCINGLKISGIIVMRRMVMGAWQYREATPGEQTYYRHG